MHGIEDDHELIGESDLQERGPEAPRIRRREQKGPDQLLWRNRFRRIIRDQTQRPELLGSFARDPDRGPEGALHSEIHGVLGANLELQAVHQAQIFCAEVQ